MQVNQLKEGIEHAFATSYEELESYTALAAAIYEAFPGARFEDVNAVLLQMVAELFQRNPGIIRKAVADALYQAPADFRDADDHAQDIYLHLAQHPEKLPGLLFPTKAKPTTTLFALVKSRMRAVRSQLANRHRLASERLADFALGGCEIAPPEELNEDKFQAA